MSEATRKSLMLDQGPYSKITAFAKEAGVPRPAVIDALLQLVDASKLREMLKQLKAEKKADSADEAKKRAALMQLAKDLSFDDILKMVEQSKG